MGCSASPLLHFGGGRTTPEVCGGSWVTPLSIYRVYPSHSDVKNQQLLKFHHFYLRKLKLWYLQNLVPPLSMKNHMLCFYKLTLYRMISLQTYPS